MVAERQYLILFTLKCVAEPAAVDYKAPRDGGAFRLIADKFDVHNLFYVAVFIVYADE